jgi:hypothetical protein
MIRTNSHYFFRMSGLVLTLVILVSTVCAAQEPGKWSVTQLSANLSQEIECTDGTKSRAMSTDFPYLEIRALFSSPDEKSLTLVTKQIAVTGAVGDGMLLGVGVSGPKGTCVYTSTLGFKGTATEQATTGDGYRLERNEGMPQTLTLLKNRCSLCLAFSIDTETLHSLQKSGMCKLTFGDATVLVPEASNK